VIHTPSQADSKFWPGDMGKMANHAVVFAKLIIKGESYGINAFFFRIRDEDTHRPLPGIEIGDIGPKYGYPHKDNGYMMFDHFRVPRSAILSRYINVQKDGNIEIKGDPRVAYATMLWIRVTLLVFNWQILALNICKTVRYSLKRTQFKSLPNSKQERQILSYQASQVQLIPELAFAYGNVFMSQFCMSIFYEMQEKIKSDDFSLMNHLHVLASSLKAYYMQRGIDALMKMREVCGGHGYSYFSSLGGWIEAWSANVTLEGDGYVLYQQTTRKLVKMLKEKNKDKFR
jgi:acyl-CoA oxidase